MHTLKYSEWSTMGHSGEKWHCNDVEDLGNGSGYWWLPARMLSMTPAAYLKWVIDNYKPDEIKYNKDCSLVYWSWNSQIAMRKFKNDINKIARDKKFII